MRLRDFPLCSKWQLHTVVAALTADGLTAPAVFDGPLDKQPAVRRAIEAVGAQLRFLPPYSPDLNPIERAFAKLKALLCGCVVVEPQSGRTKESRRRPRASGASPPS